MNRSLRQFRKTGLRRPPSDRKAGFSLLEALVALALLAIVTVAFSQAFSNALLALDRQQTHTDYVDDIRFVRSQVILEPNLETFEEGGEIETLDAGMAEWEVEVEPTEVPHLFTVHLRITFEGSEARPSWEHEELIYLLRPTWSEPLESDERMLDLQEAITDERNRMGTNWE